MRLVWDRLLETCVRTEKNALLVSGLPPFLRFEEGLQSVDVPAITLEELGEMLDEVLPSPAKLEKVRGCRSFTLRYGSGFNFRIAALGGACPRMLTVTKLPRVIPEAAAPVEEAAGDRPADVQTGEWRSLLARCEAAVGGSALLLPGSPPMLWWELGIHPLEPAPLSVHAMRQIVSAMWPPDEFRRRVDGYDRFDLGMAGGEIFRVAVFDPSGEPMAVLMRTASGARRENA
jgi:hypothetical protein